MEQQTLPLRDIHLPEAPGYWPLAPGWWLLIVIVLILIIILVKLWLNHKAKQKVIALLQAEVTTISESYKTHNDKHLLAADISILLRRFTKFILKDNTAASLSGQKWVSFLNSKLNRDVFAEHSKELTEAQFNKDVDFDVPKYIAVIRNYFTDVVKLHKQTYLKTSENDHA